MPELPSTNPDIQGSIPLVTFINVILRRRWLILVCGIIGGASLALVSLLGGYTARAVFAPTGTQSGSLGALSSVAARFGINVADPGGSPVDFYAALAKTDGLLSEIANDTFAFKTSADAPDSMSGTLVDLYDLRASTPQRKFEKTIDKLRDRVAVTVNLQAGTVNVETRAKWAALSEQITRRILDLVNRFNVEQLQSQARTERGFIEARLNDAQRDLRAAEGDLERFLSDNRTYQSSPRLAFDAARLQRQIDLRQQVYTTLASEFEEARIREIRNTPVVTIVDAPEGTSRERFKMVLMLPLGLCGGWVLGIMAAFLAEYIDQLRTENAPEAASFRSLMAGVADDLRLRRRRAGGRS